MVHDNLTPGSTKPDYQPTSIVIISPDDLVSPLSQFEYKEAPPSPKIPPKIPITVSDTEQSTNYEETGGLTSETDDSAVSQAAVAMEGSPSLPLRNGDWEK